MNIADAERICSRAWSLRGVQRYFALRWPQGASERLRADRRDTPPHYVAHECSHCIALPRKSARLRIVGSS